MNEVDLNNMATYCRLYLVHYKAKHKREYLAELIGRLHATAERLRAPPSLEIHVSEEVEVSDSV